MNSFIKRLFDIVSSLTLALVLMPILLIIAIAIVVDSRGGVFYLQSRLGRGAIPFTMYKFRTMVKDAEKLDEGLFNYADDPRVTRVGSWLRVLSLDELPQLINVLRGDMSIVGPRPPVSYELGDPENFDERTRKRFSVRPGVTGLAQVSGRNELSWDEKIEFDNKYVDRWNRYGVLSDIPILLRTILVVLTRSGAHEDASNREKDLRRMDSPPE